MLNVYGTNFSCKHGWLVDSADAHASALPCASGGPAEFITG
ncbi:hypothetical protein ABIA32_003200 [Streptacidiphilus sp. MAP12-20]